jgi:hypothetical protein
MKSPSGDILDGVTQVILPALNGLASAQHLQTITDHLVANRIAQQVDISDADLAEYTQRTTNWMRGYFVAGGKFNVRTETLPPSLPPSPILSPHTRSQSWPTPYKFHVRTSSRDHYGSSSQLSSAL